MKIKIASLTVLMSSVVSVLSMGHAAYAAVRIGGSSLRANGQVAEGYQYSGPCPVDLKFGWGVIASSPTAVTYTFSRSDGGHTSSSRTVDLSQPNRSMTIGGLGRTRRSSEAIGVGCRSTSSLRMLLRRRFRSPFIASSGVSRKKLRGELPFEISPLLSDFSKIWFGIQITPIVTS